jgi:hypothetical protein
LYLEPFFSRVWLDEESHKKSILFALTKEHEPANKLLGFSEQDWSIASKLYNTVNYENIFKVGKPQEYNAKVELDLQRLDFGRDPFLQNLTNLSLLLESNQPGTYELGEARIDIIRSVVVSEDNLIVKNPKMDLDLLTIQ